MKVLLKNGTVGEVKNAKLGQYVFVDLHDENGMPIKVSGIVVEILEPCQICEHEICNNWYRKVNN